MKRASCSAFNIWKSDGFPIVGSSCEAYKVVRKSYRLAINRQRKANKNKISKSLESSLLNGNNRSFWKVWNANFKDKGHHQPTTINKISDPKLLCEMLAEILKLLVIQMIMSSIY